MLILKSPLQLNSVKPMSIHADKLGMRIVGNYQLMSISISPQDLLHMTTLQPEVYVGIENENQFITQNQVRQKNEWKIDIINQLLNRILLYQTPFFTYQDEVYITTVLQKLGIMNVAEFMEQVKQTSLLNESMVQLLKNYYKKGKSIREKVHHFYKSIHLEKETLQEKNSKTEKENTLWSSIFKRLQTAEINNTIYDYRMELSSGPIKKEFEMSLIQQMRQADALQLAYIKQYIFSENVQPAFEQSNYYEQKHIHPTQMTEKKVLSQLTAAMLMQLTTGFHYQQYAQHTAWNFQWMDFTRALYGSTTEVIERFEDYQTSQELRTQEIQKCSVEWNRSMWEEQKMLNTMEYLQGDVLEEESKEWMEKETVFVLIEHQNMQKQLAEVLRILNSFSLQEFIYENQKIDQSYLQTLLMSQQKLYEIHQKQKEERNNIEVHLNLNRQEKADIKRVSSQQRYSSYDDWELNYYLLRDADFSKLPKTAAVGKLEKMVYRVSDETETGETSVDSMEVGQVFSSEERYIEYLNEMNQKNIEMNKRYHSKEIAAEKNAQIVLNPASARESALRALENPTEVLAEIQSKGQVIEQSFSNEAEHYLSLTDEKTRTFYNQILSKQAGSTEQVKTFRAESENEAADFIQNSVSIDEIMVNQWNQYYLIQEVLKKNLNLLKQYVENENQQEAVNETVIYNSLKEILDNSFWQTDTLQEYRENQYHDVLTEKTAKIQELIHQLKQEQVSAELLEVYQSCSVELKNLLEIQKTYLHKGNEIQNQTTGMFLTEVKEEHNPATVNEIIKNQKNLQNQWNQYTRIQEVLRKNLSILKQHIHAGDVTEVADETAIYQNLEELLENSFRQTDTLQEYRDNQYSSIFAEQITKIQELIYQIKQKNVSSCPAEIYHSVAVEIQDMVNIQNEYLNEVNEMQNHISETSDKEIMIQKSSQTEQLDKIIWLQQQYTEKLVHLMRNQIYIPVMQKQQEWVRQQEFYQNYKNQLSKLQSVITDREKYVQLLYQDRQSENVSERIEREEVTKERQMLLTSELMEVNPVKARTVMKGTEERERLEMIYNRSQIWSEDMMEEIKSSIRERVVTTQNVTEMVEKHRQVEEHITENQHQIVNRTEMNVTELIQQNLKTQLNEISNQVYQKLERKLEGERRRRGY